VVGACVSVPRKTSSSFFSSCLQHPTHYNKHQPCPSPLFFVHYVVRRTRHIVHDGVRHLCPCSVGVTSTSQELSSQVQSNQKVSLCVGAKTRRDDVMELNRMENLHGFFSSSSFAPTPFSSSSPRLPFSDAVMDGLLMDGHQQASPCHNRNKLLEQGVLTILVPMANCREILLRWCMQCFPLYLLSWLRDMSMILLNQGINRYVRWLCYDVAFFVTAFRCPILVRHPDV
jgi:hypothetical protein